MQNIDTDVSNQSDDSFGLHIRHINGWIYGLEYTTDLKIPDFGLILQLYDTPLARWPSRMLPVGMCHLKKKSISSGKTGPRRLLPIAGDSVILSNKGVLIDAGHFTGNLPKS